MFCNTKVIFTWRLTVNLVRMRVKYTLSRSCISLWQCWSCNSRQLQLCSNYRFYRNGNSTNFFRMFVITKNFKELFTSTWNEIAASVRCVTSASVVLNTKLPGQLWPTQTKEGDEKRGNPKTVTLFGSGTQTLNSSCSLDHMYNNESVIYVPMIYAGQ